MDDFELHLDAERKSKIAAFAQKMGARPQDVLEHVIDSTLDNQETYWREREEDRLRLEDCIANGGIPHEKISDWLRSIGTDSPLQCPDK